MTRFQFYGALLLLGSAGIYQAIRPSVASTTLARSLAGAAGASSPNTRAELTSALAQVDRIARAEGGGQKISEGQPISVRLRAMPLEQGLETAIQNLNDDRQSSLVDRVQIISFLRERENDFPGAVNATALQELSLKHIPRSAPQEWVLSYIENVGHLYLETAPSPETELAQFQSITETYVDSAQRKALFGAYLQLFPQRRAELESQVR